MRIVWTTPAEADLDSLVRHIARDNVRAALRMEDRILAAADRLAPHPERGRAGRRAETREFVVVGSPYLLIYRLREDRIEILRIVHGAQMWPPEEA